jgi:hypothetical protein
MLQYITQYRSGVRGRRYFIAETNFQRWCYIYSHLPPKYRFAAHGTASAWALICASQHFRYMAYYVVAHTRAALSNGQSARSFLILLAPRDSLYHVLQFQNVRDLRRGTQSPDSLRILDDLTRRETDRTDLTS